MSIPQKLRALTNSRTGLQHQEEFYRQIDSENNDRGAAILAATFLERSLEYALSRRLPIVDDESFYAVFDNEGPLSTFDNKLRMARALKVIGAFTDKNIGLVNKIRNAFAHASIPIVFATKEVSDACALFILPPNPETFRSKLEFTTPRQKYCAICEVTSSALVLHAASYVRIRADCLPGETMCPVTPLSLP